MSAKGVRLVNLEKGDVVAAAVVVPRTDEIDRHDKETKDSGQSTLPIQ